MVATERPRRERRWSNKVEREVRARKWNTRKNKGGQPRRDSKEVGGHLGRMGSVVGRSTPPAKDAHSPVCGTWMLSYMARL